MAATFSLTGRAGATTVFLGLWEANCLVSNVRRSRSMYDRCKRDAAALTEKTRIERIKF